MENLQVYRVPFGSSGTVMTKFEQPGGTAQEANSLRWRDPKLSLPSEADWLRRSTVSSAASRNSSRDPGGSAPAPCRFEDERMLDVAIESEIVCLEIGAIWGGCHKCTVMS